MGDSTWRTVKSSGKAPSPALRITLDQLRIYVGSGARPGFLRALPFLAFPLTMLLAGGSLFVSLLPVAVFLAVLLPAIRSDPLRVPARILVERALALIAEEGAELDAVDARVLEEGIAWTKPERWPGGARSWPRA